MSRTLGRGLMAAGGIGLVSTAFFVATGGTGAAAVMGLTVFDCGLLHVGNEMRKGNNPLAGGPTVK
jgi:hypothetical protein